MSFDPYSTVLFIASVLNLLLGAFVLWRHGRRRLTLSYSILALFTAGYCLWFGGLFLITDESAARLWWRLLLPFGALAMASLLRFSALLTGHDGKAVRRAVYVSYGVAVLCLLCSVPGWLPLELKRVDPGRWFASVDPVYFGLYIPSLIFNVLASLGLVLRRLAIESRPLHRRRLQIFLLGVVATMLLSMLNVVPMGPLSGLGYLDTLAFLGLTAWGFNRNRLLDLGEALNRSAASTVMAFVMVAVPLAVGHAVLTRVFAAAGAPVWLESPLVASLMLLAAIPLANQSLRLARRFFELEPGGLPARLAAYDKQLSRQVRLQDALTDTAFKLCHDLGASHAFFLVRDRVTGRFSSMGGHPAWMDTRVLGSHGPLVSCLDGRFEPLDREELEWEEEEAGIIQDMPSGLAQAAGAELRRLGAMLAVPVRGETGLQAVILLGPHEHGGTYPRAAREFLASLSLQVGAALERSALAEQLQQADRLSLLGTMAASLTHEIRNPLTSISLFVQMLPERYSQAEFRGRFMTVVGDEIRKLTRLTEQLLTFASHRTTPHGSVDALHVGGRACDLLRFQFLKKGVRLDLVPSPLSLPKVLGDEAQLSQVLINLLLNALQATATGGQVTVDLRPGSDGWLELRVRDTGIGMTPEQASRVFEPFFTTRSEGTGLGLATCHRVILEHGGTVSVESEPGQGTEFLVRLPSAPAAESPAAPAPPMAPTPGPTAPGEGLPPLAGPGPGGPLTMERGAGK